jgi:probable HAF family extracellular repeat protein
VIAGALMSAIAIGPTYAGPSYTAINLGSFGADSTGHGHSFVSFLGQTFEPGRHINNSGQVVGYSRVYDGSGNFRGRNAFLYNGGPLVNLGDFGTDPTGTFAFSYPADINDSGQVVGYSSVFDGSGSSKGEAAFLYNGGPLVNLGNFGTDATGAGFSYATAINRSGQVAGYSSVFDGSGNNMGYAAFLYDGGALINLGNFGTNVGGGSTSVAYAINDSGQVVGYSVFTDGNGNNMGNAAFLYDGGPLINLGHLSTDPSGHGNSGAIDINNSGQVVGQSSIFDSSGNDKGEAAFLYDGGSLINLGNLSSHPTGAAFTWPAAINDSGQVVGYAALFDGNGDSDGVAAFLYDGGPLINLGNFGTDPAGFGWSYAHFLSEDGTVIGRASYWTGTTLSNHAAISFGGGAFQDLNLLTTGLGNFTLNEAVAINASGQIAATGCNAAECRAFLLNPVNRAPEPTTLVLVGLGIAGLAASRRRELNRSSGHRAMTAAPRARRFRFRLHAISVSRNC